jgi:glycerol-3-phosphate dehydrogenase
VIDRATAWSRLQETLDIVIVGGGITGAAVLWEATRRGLRAGLVESHDFASGTSSRSSKLVHGGLRYLREGKIGLTRESVREREELLRDAPGLVDSIPFVMPHYRNSKPGRTTLALGLALYDTLAGSWNHRYADRDEALMLIPGLDDRELLGAHVYGDATTDDAGLVLRLIGDACASGATAINYSPARLAFEGDRVAGIEIADPFDGVPRIVRARATVAATGVFADALRSEVDGAPRLRPLRGSHLVVADWRLPLAASVAWEHPRDRRPVFAYPWLGRTLIGTTDLDHDRPLSGEPAIAPSELAYLLEAVHARFPSLDIGTGDIVATFAGVRPVVDDRAGSPSQASRDHIVWNERGLITITGGKLTTFRPMAMDALRAAAGLLPAFALDQRPVFTPATPPHAASLSETSRLRLAGRYGAAAQDVVDGAGPGELETIDTTPVLWAEVRYGARHGAIVHLDDLLLRRTRIGMLLEGGGARHLDRIGAICREELGWDLMRWDDEAATYLTRIRSHYGIPA